MRFVFAVLTALSLGIGGFVATGHNPTSAGPVSLFGCRPQFRIFNCFLPVVTVTSSTSSTTSTTTTTTTSSPSTPNS